MSCSTQVSAVKRSSPPAWPYSPRVSYGMRSMTQSARASGLAQPPTSSSWPSAGSSIGNIGVELRVLGGAAPDREALRAVARLSGVLAGGLEDRRREAVVGIERVRRDLRSAAVGAGDRRRPARHRLHEHQPERLALAGERGDVRLAVGGEERRGVREIAVLDAVGRRTAAVEHQPRTGPLATYTRERGEQRVRPLV